ncbi:MAG: hypothetical protein ACYC2W_03625 [Desulfurivibrionaceae bacterium]
MANKLKKKWKKYSYSSYEEMPTPLVAVSGITGFILSSLLGYLLVKVGTPYLELASNSSLDAWGLEGWFVTAIFAGIGLAFWFFGSLAWRCNSILRERLFK